MARNEGKSTLRSLTQILSCVDDNAVNDDAILAVKMMINGNNNMK